MKRIIEYKNSGLEWIDSIPQDWEIRRIKYLFGLRNERNHLPMKEVRLLSLYTGSSELFVFRCSKMNAKLLYYYFQTNEFLEFGKSTMYGVAGLKRVNADLLRNKYIPVPPPLEQAPIVLYIEQQASRIDYLVTDIQTQIEKLKEYRQSIISEAVTGKVAI